MVSDAFGEIEKQDRRCLLNLVPNGVEISSNTPRGRCYPLVTDFNPALPNLARIINKFKHILDIDPKVSRVIPPEGVFVSFRRAKNFKDLVVHSKLRGSIDNNVCKFVNLIFVVILKVSIYVKNPLWVHVNRVATKNVFFMRNT